MYQLIVVYNKQYLPRIYSYFTIQGKPSTYIRIFFVYTLQEAHQLFLVTIICIHKKKDPPAEHHNWLSGEAWLEY